MDMEGFKRWKPHLWDGVVSDYDLAITNDLDGVPTPAALPSSSDLPVNISTLPPSLSDDDRVLRKLEEINLKIDGMKFQEREGIQNELWEIIKCTLCLDTVVGETAFCCKSGTFIGCLECVNNIEPGDERDAKCPLCPRCSL